MLNQQKYLYAALLLITVFFLSAFCLKRRDASSEKQNPCCDSPVEKWLSSALPVVLHFGDKGSPQLTPGESFDAMRRAMSSWNNVKSSFFAFKEGTIIADSAVTVADRRNVIIFDRDGDVFENAGIPNSSNVLAFSRTFSILDRDGYHAIDSDLVLNAKDHQFKATPDRNSFDLESIIGHELGHHLGLDHPGGNRDIPEASSGCGPVVQAATMFFAQARNRTNARSLEEDDRAGITAIYPKWKITGIVLDAHTSSPLQQTKLRLLNTRSPLDTILVDEIVTNENGFFSFPVMDSVATISICRPGYKSEEIALNFETPDTKSLSIGLLPQALGALSGKITASTTGREIQADYFLYGDGKLMATGRTDALGNLDINDIPVSNPPCFQYDRLEIKPLLNYQDLTIENIVIGSSQPIALNIELEEAAITIIDDDNGADAETGIAEALKALNFPIFIWDVAKRGSPATSLPEITSSAIFWIGHPDSSKQLTATDLDSLERFVAEGRDIVVSSSSAATQYQNSDFFKNIFHAQTAGTAKARVAKGIPADPVSENLLIGLFDEAERAVLNTDGNQNAQLAFSYTDNADNDLGGAGVRFEGNGYKALFLSFDLTTAATNHPSFATPQVVLSRITSWLNLTTGIPKDPETTAAAALAPDAFNLSASYPNPVTLMGAKTGASIRYTIGTTAASSPVEIAIYNILGQRIATLVNTKKSAGSYTATWNGLLTNGAKAPAGVYFFQMRTGTRTKSQKLIVIE